MGLTVGRCLARRSLLVACVWAGFLGAARTGSAQQVNEARMFARILEDGSAEVRIEYDLTAEGRTPVPIDLLGFGDASASEVRVVGGGGPVVLWPASGARFAASIERTDSTARAGRLALEYVIARAVEIKDGAVHGRLPVAAVDWPPVEGSGELFLATVELPTGWAISESFPTGMRQAAQREGRQASPGSTAHEVSLAVIPALVSFRGRTDGRWSAGLPLLLEIATVLILSVFGLFGWRHLRRLAE